MADAELDAMAAVSTALEGLEATARERVLLWAAAKFEVGLGSTPRGAAGLPPALFDSGSGSQEFQEVSDLVDAAQPSNGPERALAVGYWLQELRGRESWTGADVNSALKNMGAGVANVTATLNSLKARKPALVMQTGKSGRSQQARKSYKLTTAGLREVREMIAKVANSEVA
jgi:hypothetical protein